MSTTTPSADGVVKGGDAVRNDGAWVAALIIGCIVLFVCAGYGIYVFMCKTVKDENDLRSTTTTTNRNNKKPRANLSLPKGWEEHLDGDGDTYYYHEETETTSWDHPTAKKHSRVKSTGESLPSGWERHTAEDGEFYYENSEGNVQWDAPT